MRKGETLCMVHVIPAAVVAKLASMAKLWLRVGDADRDVKVWIIVIFSTTSRYCGTVSEAEAYIVPCLATMQEELTNIPKQLRRFEPTLTKWVLGVLGGEDMIASYTTYLAPDETVFNAVACMPPIDVYLEARGRFALSPDYLKARQIVCQRVLDMMPAETISLADFLRDNSNLWDALPEQVTMVHRSFTCISNLKVKDYMFMLPKYCGNATQYGDHVYTMELPANKRVAMLPYGKLVDHFGGSNCSDVMRTLSKLNVIKPMCDKVGVDVLVVNYQGLPEVIVTQGKVEAEDVYSDNEEVDV